jgi:ketosteroid isomerase-like protein
MRRLGTILIMAATWLACTPAPPQPADTRLTPAHAEAMTDSINTVLASWRAAINALDVEGAAAFYLADSTFRWIEDGVVRYRSRAEVADAIRELAGSVRRTELLMDGTIITPLAPGVAAVTTGFAQKVEDHEGRVGGFAGAISMVLVHREEGWQFQLGHTSSGAPTGE